MRLSHDPGKTHASFDDPNLVSRAGLVPVMALAERAGLAALVREHVSVGGPCGVNAELKVPCLVAGMAAGADSIDDMDVLRHGAMPDLFGGVRAPSTLGSFLRSFTWGNVRQLDAVARRMLAELAAARRRCCPAARYWRSSTWTRCRNGSTGTPSRAPGSGTPRSRARPCWSAA